MKRAFSTLEILIAMTILVMSVTAVTLLMPTTRATGVDTEVAQEAISLAQSAIEGAQSNARKDFRLVVPTTTTRTLGPLTYTTQLAVEPQTDLYSRKVTATVSWTGQYGRSQNVTLTSLASDFENVTGGDTCSSVLTGNWASPNKTDSLLGTVLGDTAGAYAITDVDAYQKRLYVGVNQSSQNTGARYGGTGVNDSSVGTLGWVNPNNATTDNSSYATRVLSGTAVTNYVKVTNFGFAIPQGATILGIQVEVERSRTGGSTGEVRDSQVRIVRSGTIGSTNRALTTTNWPTTDTFQTYGGTTDLWGEGAWSSAEINSANFGAVIAVTGSSASTNRTAQIDSVRITVTYIKSLYVLDITNPNAPTFLGGQGTSTVQTGIVALHAASSTVGSYVYAATNAGPASGQLEIIKTTTMPPVLISTTAVPGVTGTGAQALGNSIFYKDGYVYLGLTKAASGPEFVIMDVHNPLAPTLIGDYDVDSTVNEIFVRGNYAYLGTADNAREFVTLSLADPLNPTLVSSYDAPGSTGFGYGRSLYTVGDRLYGGRTYVSNADELAILDIQNPAVTPPLLGSSNIGVVATPYGVYGTIVRDTLAFILTNSGAGGRLEIRNIQNPGVIGSATVVALPNTGSGVALDCEGNYMYAASVPSSGSFLNRGSITTVTAP